MGNALPGRIHIVSTNESAIGGVTRVCLAMGAGFAREGWDVVVDFPGSVDQQAVRRWARAADVTAGFPDCVPADTGGRPWRRWIDLARHLRRGRPTVVSVHYGGSDLSLKDVLAARLSGAHTRLVHLHSPSRYPVSRRKWLMNWIASRLASAVVAVSDEVAELSRSTGTKASRLQVIPGGVLPPGIQVTKAEARDRLRIPQAGYVVCSVARLAPEKGLTDLIEAVRLLPRTDITLVIQGHGPLYEEISLAGASALGERFMLLSPDEDTELVFAASDLFALPSYIEGAPLVLMEAAFRGLPVVSTLVGGIPSLVKDQETGLLVSPGAPAELADVINRLLDNDRLRMDYGHAALQLANERFSAEVMTAKLRALLG